MADHIWLVRSPEGRVIGVSVAAAGAVRDVKSHCGATTGSAMNDLSQIVYDNLHTENYEHNGYTLTREPLPAPVAASEATSSPGISDAQPVAWGIFTKGIGLVGHRSNQRQSITAMMASGVGDYTAPLYTHPSAAEVVELDEWRVVDRDGKPALFLRGAAKLDVAQESVHDQDHRWPELAPHRVMRVCLKEVDRG